MIKISEAVTEIFRKNVFFEFGLSNRIMNLSQLAKFIHPLVESRLQREVQVSAITMNLSRMQDKLIKKIPKVEDFTVENISIQSNLVVFSMDKRPNIRAKMLKMAEKVNDESGYFVFSESTSEMTVVTDKSYISFVEKNLMDIKYKNEKIASISVKFDEELFKMPGLLYALMQKLNLQNINLIEVASTYTEFIFFVEESDIYLAFETIHKCFGKKS